MNQTITIIILNSMFSSLHISTFLYIFVYNSTSRNRTMITCFIIISIFLQDFFCIIPGLVYFVALPSMYMFMFLYSIGNLHTLSLGTIETKQASDSTKADKKDELEKNRKGYSISQRNCLRYY